MKYSLLILAVVVFSFTSCKTKKEAVETNSPQTNQSTMATQDQTTPKTKGKISHQYKATGCATVVIIKTEENTITLIPKDKLPEKLDVDGMEISFDYRPLKMRNPEGCNVGFPAELTNITSSK